MLIKKMNNKRNVIYRSVKINKRNNQKLLKNRKKKILEENRRKMLEIQWRVRLAKLSTSMHKQKIKNIGWRINKWYDGKDGSQYRTVEVRKHKRFDSPTRGEKPVAGKKVTLKPINKTARSNLIWKTTKNVSYRTTEISQPIKISKPKP